MMKTHKPIDQFRDSYIGFRLANDLNELLIRACGDNRSAFIRDAIKLHILSREEDEKILSGTA